MFSYFALSKQKKSGLTGRDAVSGFQTNVFKWNCNRYWKYFM